MRIHELKIGQQAKILALSTGDKTYRQKLIAMGVLPGTTFTLLRIAPLGDPVEIQIRGFALSLRKDEASLLRIEEI